MALGFSYSCRNIVDAAAKVVLKHLGIGQVSLFLSFFHVVSCYLQVNSQQGLIWDSSRMNASGQSDPLQCAGKSPEVSPAYLIDQHNHKSMPIFRGNGHRSHYLIGRVTEWHCWKSIRQGGIVAAVFGKCKLLHSFLYCALLTRL